MSQVRFPRLDHPDLEATKLALHAYARLLGAYLKSVRPRRKHLYRSVGRPRHI